MKKFFSVFISVLYAFMLTSCSNGGYITEQTAKEKALSHAGITKEQTRHLKTKLDTNGKQRIYEVEFYYGGMEYDYEIDAKNGNVVSFDYERVD